MWRRAGKGDDGTLAPARPTPADAERFRRDGYLSIAEPLVDADGVARATALLEPLFDRPDLAVSEHRRELAGDTLDEPSVAEVAWATHLVPDLLRTEAFRTMRAVATALLGTRVKLLYEHAIFKAARTGGITSWHQDVAFNLADDVPCATTWLALDEVDEENGCMSFVPGSHLGPILPHVAAGRDGLQVVGDGALTAGAVRCPLPAGGMTVHQQRTLHASGPNRSAGVRHAWIAKFVEDDRPAHRRIAREVATTVKAARSRWA